MKKLKNRILLFLIRVGVIHVRTELKYTGSIGLYKTYKPVKNTFHLGRKKIKAP